MYYKTGAKTISEREFKKNIPEEYFELKHKIHALLLDLIDLTVIEKLEHNTIKSQIRKLVESILREDGHGVPLTQLK